MRRGMRRGMRQGDAPGGLTTHPFLKQSSLFFKMLYKIQNFFIKCIINDSSAISAANEYEKEIFLTFNKNSKIKIVRNGINLKTLVSQENFKQKYKINNKFILFVGRFFKQKKEEIVKPIKISHSYQLLTDCWYSLRFSFWYFSASVFVFFS